MRIKALTIKNFRQFYGENEITFSCDAGSMITVVHGENGAGKTSLLNAFKWVLYGATDFDTGEQSILNELVLTEVDHGGTVELSIMLEFEHDDVDYTALRKQEYRRLPGALEAEPIGKAVLDVSWVDNNGRFERSSNPTNHINQIIPEKMHTYFFFNGERIEKLANVSAAGEIRSAIRTLMGLEIVERASDHLGRLVIKDVRKEASESASEDYSKLLVKQGELSDRRDEIDREKKDAEVNKEGFQKELDAINDSYERIVEVREKTARRKELERVVERFEHDLEILRIERNERVARLGALAFLSDAIERTASRLEECRKKGELPYKIRRTFVDDLLKQESCICGTLLIEGSTERANVQAYRDKATEEDVEAAFTETVGNLGVLPREREGFFEQLKVWSAKETGLEESAKDAKGELDEIGSTLVTSEIEDVKKLEARRQELSDRQAKENTRRDKALADIGAIDDDLKALKQEIDKVKSKSEKEDLARRRLDYAVECKNLLDQLHEALSEETRKHLSQKVNATFREILRKDFWAEIDEEYTLRIFKNVPGVGKQFVSEKSTGENQVTSLSFIASLVSLAKERNKNKGAFFKGGVFPIIMDSPFGALDKEYREKISENIPKLADQVVIFASNSQWSEEVDKRCRPYIGKEYSLIYHAPKIRDSDYDSAYVKRTEGPEFTTIEEGYYG
ncbi:DNA sulfur modification protein DndD [Natronocella acetinitrilica]|uniref:DNA sulfur modification protein DndD n=1 Tax=Natronocella acetinitrilica TaxID=414046 RepID=A0AAE3KDB4_9GAMM|nr:AAA family ATPase [Natronocella acetinitrilica]MCP1676641.1 DNA sulfur modification protein DndD [Natronocella acetinitrilica]